MPKRSLALTTYNRAKRARTMSTALIPYASKYRVYSNYARMGLRAGKAAYRGYRRFKSLRAKKMAGVGKRVGAHTSKKSDNKYEWDNLNTRTAYCTLLNSLAQDVTRIDARDGRDIVNFRGVKICFEIHNRLTGKDDILYFNWAIVKAKHLCDDDVPVAPMKRASDFQLPMDKFFRSYDGNRSEAFSEARSAIEFKCSPINTDEFVVLSHKRFQVLNASDQNMGRHYKFIDKYLPVNRQIRYMPEGDPNNPGDNLPIPGDRLHLVYWCDNPNKTAGNAVRQNHFNVRIKVVKYIRDSK